MGAWTHLITFNVAKRELVSQKLRNSTFATSCRPSNDKNVVMVQVWNGGVGAFGRSHGGCRAIEERALMALVVGL